MNALAHEKKHHVSPPSPTHIDAQAHTFVNLLAHSHCWVHSIASTRPMGQTGRLNRHERKRRRQEEGHCSLSSFLSFCLLPLRLNTRAHTHTYIHTYTRTHFRPWWWPMRTLCKLVWETYLTLLALKLGGRSSRRYSTILHVFLLSLVGLCIGLSLCHVHEMLYIHLLFICFSLQSYLHAIQTFYMGICGILYI